MDKSTDLESIKSQCVSMKFPPLPLLLPQLTTPPASAEAPRGRLVSSRVVRVSEASCLRVSLYSDATLSEQHEQNLLPIEHKLSRPSTFSQLLMKQNALLEQKNNMIFWYLPLFQTSLLATVLEDMLTKIRFLGECNTPLRILQLRSNKDLLNLRKFEVEDGHTMTYIDKLDQKQFNCNKNKLHKLEADRNKITTVISNLYLELSKESSCITIYDFVLTTLHQMQYEVWLAEDLKRKIFLEKELSKKLRLQRNQQTSIMYAKNLIVENLRSQIDNNNITTEITGRYVNKWQAARVEQFALIQHEAESSCIKSTDYFKTRSENELRVHHEVESFTNQIIQETATKIDEWIEKYDVDIEQMDLKIQQKRNEYLAASEERNKLEEKFQRHVKEILIWVTYKKEREKAQEYGKRMTKSAIIVQSWWRGLLVRRKLGPFRIKKKRKVK